MKSKEELIEEIKQISTQYHSEVGRDDRKAWPKAIKDRITELFLAGAKATEVAKATGLPYFTVLKWPLFKSPPTSLGVKLLTRANRFAFELRLIRI